MALPLFRKHLSYKNSIIVFIVSLLVVSTYYNFPRYLFYHPQSIHFWRQSDCASTALLYSEHGMHFFKPEVHNLLSDGETTGFAVGELPVIYYLAGAMYRVFGHHEFILRGITLLIVFIGLFYFFMLAYLLSGDSFWSVVLPLLLFTSPLLVYYSNNYLPEAPSLGLNIIGWYFFFKFYKKPATLNLVLSVIFFAFAAMIKVTSGMSLIVLIILWVVEAAGFVFLSRQFRLYKLPVKSAVIIMTGVAIVVCWYAFAIHYNAIHNSGYFRTGILGFWQISPIEIDKTFTQMGRNWKFFIYNDSVYFIMGFVYVLVLINYKEKLLLFINSLLIAGVLLFLMLWFGLLQHHDYYFVPLLILTFLLFISWVKLGSTRYPGIFSSWVIKVAALIVLIINVNYAKNKVNGRYNETPSADIKKEMVGIEGYAEELGIHKSDKVICTCDYSPNHMLYLMNRQGWTDFNNLQGDSLKVVNQIKNGAKYLVVYDQIPEEYYHLLSFINNKIGEKDNVVFFTLKTPEQLEAENNKISVN